MGVRKSIIFILIFFIFFSCRSYSPCISDCYLEDDFIVLKLNARYKIGDINGGRVGDCYFFDNKYFIEKNEKEIIIKFYNTSVFETGTYYKIGVEWLRGNVSAIGRFENNKFIIMNEDYSEAPYL